MDLSPYRLRERLLHGIATRLLVARDRCRNPGELRQPLAVERLEVVDHNP